MTNFEKIKQMGINELAECLLDEFRVDCEECRENYEECRYCIKRWLESETVGRMTLQEAIEIITNAIQTENMTAEQDKALAIVQKALEKQIPKRP